MNDEKNTNLMDAYKIRDSIQDVLAILDSAPVQPDLVPERNLVQLTNRIPIAHLAIERGMKGLIKRAGGGQEETHSLGKLYDILRTIDIDSANFLAIAFEDAVNLYGYNPNRSGFEQFRSIEEYFSRVGGKKAFDALRYWAIGDPGTGETAIKFISPPIHREILCAVRSLLISRPETTSERVDSEIVYAMWNRRFIYWTNEDDERKTAIESYRNWLMKESNSPREALRSKVLTASLDFSHVYIEQVFREGWDDIQKVNDPAVRYYVNTLSYLQKDSQPQDPNAIPEVEWFTECIFGEVNTPGGNCLGFVEKWPDGAWAIDPLEQGFAGVKAVALKLKDAKNFLVDRLTSRVSVTVDGHRQVLRIIGNDYSLGGIIWSRSREVTDDRMRAYDLVFWDDKHSLTEVRELSLVTMPEGDSRVVTVLKGVITWVAGANVTVEGNDWSELREPE